MSKAAYLAGEEFEAPQMAWIVLAVLFVAYVVAFADRYLLSLFIQPIKHDLQLSDTRVSILHGLAFTIFYTVMGVPMGRLADRYSRRNLIAGGIAAWSMMTAACGLAQNFWQLFAARIGVGIGESALSPAAVSMIADLFPPNQLGRAMSIYTSGAVVGGGLAFIGGGLLFGSLSEFSQAHESVFRSLHAWQLAFIALGLPGVIVALVVRTLREPARRGRAGPVLAECPPLREALSFVWRRRSLYLPHFLGFTWLAVIFNAVLAWMPTHLLRTYGMPMSRVGPELGIILLLFGSLGILLGGWLADARRAQGAVTAPLQVGILAGAGALPFAIAAPLAHSPTASIMLSAPLLFFAMSSFGAALAALQQVTPNRLRGMVAALYLFVGNIVGLGLAPTAVALCTDYLFKSEAAVGRSVALVTAASSVLAVLTLTWGLKPFREQARAVA